MAWSSSDDDDAAILRGRRTLGAAVRRARLRHGLSQRQLGWYVRYDQTTISRLETAKLKGMRFRMLARLIGVLAGGDAFDLELGPCRSPRRLPGEVDANQPASEPRTSAATSYDVDGHGPEETEIDGEFRAYEEEGGLADTG